LADLGNVRSRTARTLIEYLQRKNGGYDDFVKMGLVRPTPRRDTWPQMSPNDVIGFLRSWSSKQVRTHFDRLHKAGMITAEREPANGPWRYELPESLTDTSSVFRNLPSAEELAAEGPG
jgi:hypothetical protein